MSAIITDQLRVLNSENFASGIKTSANSHYVFVGLPNATSVLSTWNSSPPSPVDNFDEESKYWETMIALKRIMPSDVKRVVRKNTWTSGRTYELYRHDYSIDNQSAQTKSSTLYEANYYVINKDYRVYICLQNGTTPETPNGKPSLDEPLFTDLEPRPAGTSNDGYIWKYLYTISPSEVVKFDSLNYIPTPDDWKTNSDTAAIYQNSLTSGQIKICLIKNRGNGYTPGIYSDVKINGDGSDATASVTVDSLGTIQSIDITNGGYGYTYADVDLSSASINNSSSSTDATFTVIIPPKGGHGYDIYRELGANKVLIYSKLENDNTNPDFITGNEFARIGIIKNPETYGSNSILSQDKASAAYALKITGTNTSSTTFAVDSLISQTISTGVTAYGKVLSWDSTTGVLKYWQERSTFTDKKKVQAFTSTPDTLNGGSLSIVGGTSTVSINTSFSDNKTTVINKVYNLGQQFYNGISNPEVKKYSGDIIYVDNRPSITRSINQREDIKIILEF